MGIVRYKDDDVYVLQAALDKIKSEMDRIYWNYHQKELASPFENTGISYSNSIFTVRAYNWDSNIKPNFEYKDLKVWWYKHSNRGTYAECGHHITIDEVNKMIVDCVESYEKDWKGESPNE